MCWLFSYFNNSGNTNSINSWYWVILISWFFSSYAIKLISILWIINFQNSSLVNKLLLSRWLINFLIILTNIRSLSIQSDDNDCSFPELFIPIDLFSIISSNDFKHFIMALSFPILEKTPSKLFKFSFNKFKLKWLNATNVGNLFLTISLFCNLVSILFLIP